MTNQKKINENSPLYPILRRTPRLFTRQRRISPSQKILRQPRLATWTVFAVTRSSIHSRQRLLSQRMIRGQHSLIAKAMAQSLRM